MKGNLKYIIATLLMVFFFLPLAASFVVFILTSIIPYLGFSYLLLIVAAIMGLAAPLSLGYGWRHLIRPAESETLRYAVLSAPIFYYSVVWLLVAIFSHLNLVDTLVRIHYYLMIIYAGYQWTALYNGILYGGTVVALTVQFLFWAGYYLADRWANPLLTFPTARKHIFLPMWGCLILSIAMMLFRPAHIASVTMNDAHAERLLTIAWQAWPDIRIKDNWPRLDGEEESWPLYAAAFYRLYRGVPDENDYLQRNDQRAFERLLAGESDLLIATADPHKQKALAQEKGVQLMMTPVAQTRGILARSKTQKQPPVGTLYIITRENPTAETQTLVDWFISPQGQAMAQNLGYVPLYPVAE